MFSFEINIVCDQQECNSLHGCFRTDALRTPDIELAKEQARAEGWLFGPAVTSPGPAVTMLREQVNADRAICPKCAAGN